MPYPAREPFCFVTPLPHAALDTIAPITRELAQEPQLAEDYAR